MQYCRDCGTALESGAKLCSDCGAKVAADRSRSTRSSLAGRTWINALIGGGTGFTVGAMIATVLAPLYVMGILAGGALAGYLQDAGSTAGAKVGALSGLLATAPVVLLLVVLGTAGTVATLLGAGRHLLPPENSAIWFGGALILAIVLLVLATVTNVLFGALGGFIGDAIGTEPGRDK